MKINNNYVLHMLACFHIMFSVLQALIRYNTLIYIYFLQNYKEFPCKRCKHVFKEQVSDKILPNT